MKLSFNFEDASQIFVGSFALAVPISFSEEAWRLGRDVTHRKFTAAVYVIRNLSWFLYL